MKTFIEWLDEAVFGSKVKLHGYNHYLCDKCGQTLDDNWVKDFGMRCLCGGRLSEVDSDDIDRHDAAYYKALAKRPQVLRGSAK